MAGHVASPVCACALLVATKARPEDAAILSELVYSVELCNATRYGENVKGEAAAAPPVPTVLNPVDFFDQVLDDFFDEDVFMGTEELDPPMPIGDHFWIIYRFNICSAYIFDGPVFNRHRPTVRPPQFMSPYITVTKYADRTHAWRPAAVRASCR